MAGLDSLIGRAHSGRGNRRQMLDIIGSLYDIIGSELNAGTVTAEDLSAIAAARQIDPKASFVVPRTPARRRRKWCGGERELTAGQSLEIIIEPQELFRPERLISTVVGAAANIDDVYIDDVKTGTQSANVGSAPIPAKVFAPDAWDSSIELKSVNPGEKILVKASNRHATDPRTINITFLGTSGED